MIRINITSGINNFSADFDTQINADAWIAEQIAANSWGKPDRWLSFLGEPDAGHTDSRVVEDITEYFYPREYSISVLDITVQHNLEIESNEAKQYLLSTDWLIIREMDSGEPCPQEIKDLRAAARLKVIN